jgi:acyl-CoA dehydrogenase
LDEVLTDEEAVILDGIRGFIEHEVVKRHESNRELFEDPRQLYDPDGRLNGALRNMLRDVRKASAVAGYYTMFAPRELGGGGLGATLWYEVFETVFRQCGPNYWLGWDIIAHWAKGPSPVLRHVSGQLRDAVLPGLMSGETSMCFAMSEPDAGADLWGMKTRADLDGETWRINGIKQWITNGPYAQHALVFAVTDPDRVAQRKGGITAFLVPTDADGFRVASVIRMFGAGGGDEAVLHLDNVRVSSGHVVGEIGSGLEIGMLGIGLGKLYNAAKAVGLGRWALARAAEQIRTRETFGRVIGEYQGVLFPIAESATELRAARWLALDAARAVEQGNSTAVEVAMAKAFSTEAGLRAIDRSIQVHGATGFTNELHLVHAWHDIRKVLVADGSAELMRRQIGREILRGRLQF